jgi:hypothetical protein
VLLPFDIGNTFDVGSVRNTPQYNLGLRVILLLFLLLPMILSVYSINCMMVGGCRTWSWIQTVLILVWVVAFATLVVIATTDKKKTLTVDQSGEVEFTKE